MSSKSKDHARKSNPTASGARGKTYGQNQPVISMSQQQESAPRIIGPALPENLRKRRAEDDDTSSSSEEDVRQGARHELMADLNEKIKDSLTSMSEQDRARLDKRIGKKPKASSKDEDKGNGSTVKLLGAVSDEHFSEADEQAYYNDRGPSLMELHRQKRIETQREKMARKSEGSSKAYADRVQFDPTRDLKVNMFDSKRSREIVKQARGMQEKFSVAKYT